MKLRAAAILLYGLLATGCAAAPRSAPDPNSSPASDLASLRTIGPGPLFRPGPTGALVARAAPVEGMACTVGSPIAWAAHVEVFAANHVVVIPAGIGLAPPLIRHGAYAHTQRSAYPLRTVEPTGLVLTQSSAPRRTLGQLFDLWGQPLDRRHVAGFHARRGHQATIFLNGVLWQGSPRAVPLVPNAQITIEIGPHVPPHARYTFPPLRSLRAN